MNKSKFIGVDGCKAGWFFICIDQGEEITFGLLSSIEELWQFCSCENTLFLIDIPIGLPSKGIPARRCDKDARRILSPKRHSSVFSPPSREALNADSYEAACRINKKITGRKISRQAWGITPKIREMDEFLKKQPEAGICIRETHPEVCFWALNGGKAMSYSKKTEAGNRERMAVLTPYLSKVGTVLKASLDRYPLKDVARDDVLDAIALAVVGFACGGKMSAFPETPEKDTCGFPMEIVYCQAKVEKNPQGHGVKS